MTDVKVVIPEDLGDGITYNSISEKFEVDIKNSKSLTYSKTNGLEVRVSPDPSNQLVQTNDGLYYSEQAHVSIANVYVDVINGSDNNDGSRDSPFKTLIHALNIDPSYSISRNIHIRCGQNHVIQGTDIRSGTIKIYSYDDPYIDGDKTIPVAGLDYHKYSNKNINRPSIRMVKYGTERYVRTKSFHLWNSTAKLEFHGVNIDLCPAFDGVFDNITEPVEYRNLEAGSTCWIAGHNGSVRVVGCKFTFNTTPDNQMCQFVDYTESFIEGVSLNMTNIQLGTLKDGTHASFGKNLNRQSGTTYKLWSLYEVFTAEYLICSRHVNGVTEFTSAGEYTYLDHDNSSNITLANNANTFFRNLVWESDSRIKGINFTNINGFVATSNNAASTIDLNSLRSIVNSQEATIQSLQNTITNLQNSISGLNNAIQNTSNYAAQIDNKVDASVNSVISRVNTLEANKGNFLTAQKMVPANTYNGRTSSVSDYIVIEEVPNLYVKTIPVTRWSR